MPSHALMGEPVGIVNLGYRPRDHLVGNSKVVSLPTSLCQRQLVCAFQDTIDNYGRPANCELFPYSQEPISVPCVEHDDAL